MFAKQNLKNFWVAKVFQLIHAQHLGREKKRLRSTAIGPPVDALESSPVYGVCGFPPCPILLKGRVTTITTDKNPPVD